MIKTLLRRNSIAVIQSMLLTVAVAQTANATQVFNFDGANPLDSPIISGDKANFVTSTTFAEGTNSIKFVDNSPEPYESWTYDLPAGFLTGTVELWFRSDVDLAPALPANTWGASFIIEDADNPSDFGSIEFGNTTFAQRWWGGEGSVDRLLAADTIDTNTFPLRATAGPLASPNDQWHRARFIITPTLTTLEVDGVQSTQVGGPGSEVSAGVPRTLRFRHLAASAKVGGFSNYVTTPNPTSSTAIAAVERVYIDDFTVTQLTPTASTAFIGFEVAGTVADHDTVPFTIGATTVARRNIAEQKGFVNKFRRIDTAANVLTGAASATFNPGPKRNRKLVFDLATATPGTISLRVYDSRGQENGRNRWGGSIVIQEKSTPTNWIAAEFNNFNFPFSGDATPTPTPPDSTAFNYYFSESDGPGAAKFYSRYFGNRSTGWQDVTIVLTATTSQILINGVEASNPTPSFGDPGVQFGPGINDGIQLVLLADSAANGQGGNFADTEETVQEYESSFSINDDFLYFDTISLPLPAPSSISEWNIYQ